MATVKIPKKVNRHVIKAIDFLQTSRTDFVHVEAIQDQVRRSLRYTKPVRNLEDVINDSLRKQTELGFLTRSGSSRYAINLAFRGLRFDRNGHKIKKIEDYKRTSESLTSDEIAKVRNMLHGVQKPVVKTRPGVMAGACCRGRPRRNLTVRPMKPFGNGNPIICDKSVMNIEKLSIPKKVNRHVFKAVRYLTHSENCKFVPLDKIKSEAKWTMINLKPVKDIETVIEHSLTNLSNMGVLSERLGSYRLNRVQSLRADSSFEIFGKVSKSFFYGTPMDSNVRPVAGVIEMAPRVGNASSIELSGDPFHPSLVTAEPDESQYISYMNGSEMLFDKPMSEQTSLVPIIIDSRATEGVFGVDPNAENVSSMEYSGGPFHEPLVTGESLYKEKQSGNESANNSYMNSIELPLEEPLTEQTSSLDTIFDFRVPEKVFGRELNVENASSTEHCGIQFSQDIHSAHKEREIDLHASFARAAQSFHESYLQSDSNQRQSLILREANVPTIIGGQFSPLTSDIDLNIRPVDGIFGTALSVEHSSSIELNGGPSLVPLVNSKSFSQQIESADESLKSGYMFLEEPVSDDLKVSVCQGKQSGSYLGGSPTATFANAVTEDSQKEKSSTYILAEQSSSLVPIILDFRVSEGAFGEVPNVDNARCDIPFCQEIDNAHIECEMDVRASSQDVNASFSRAAQSFQESLLQSNETPTLFLREATSEAEESADI